MFDEIYYAKDAKAIVDGRVGTHGPYRWAAGDEVSWPHPEMGKFAIALGILLFGDRSFGWRLPAVIAGLGLLACVYPLGRRLGLPPPWAILALLFAAADPIGIAQSRIATLDIFIAVWTVVCILLALRYVQDGWRTRWLFVSGAAGGMAVATKWSGGLAIIAAALIIVAAWILQRREVKQAAAGVADDGTPQPAQPRHVSPLGVPPHAEAVPAPAPQGSAGRHIAPVVALVAVPIAVYMLSFTQYFLHGHTIADFIELTRQAIYFNLHLHATPGPRRWRPRGSSTIARSGTTSRARPRTTGSSPSELAPLVARVRVPRGGRRAGAPAPLGPRFLPAAAVIAVLYAPWFLTTRTSFLYYMTPVAPFMAILAAAALCLFAGGMVPRRGWLTAGAAGACRSRPVAAHRDRRRLALSGPSRAAPAPRSATWGSPWASCWRSRW